MSEATAHVEALLRKVGVEDKPRYVPGNAEGTVYEKAPILNKQLYENSSLSGSEIEQDYAQDPDALYNSKAPNLAILHEKPEHRVIIFLKAQGLSYREISDRTGHTIPWISQVLRQPWARARLVKEIQSAGRDAVQELIKAAAEDSVFTLIEQRDNEKAKPAERINAANSLLDRFLGKPTQKVESHITTSNLKTIEDLERQLKDVEAEEKRLTGNN